jgi:uncharacterized protein YggE
MKFFSKHVFLLTLLVGTGIMPGISMAQTATDNAVRPARTLSIVGEGQFEAKPEKAELTGTVVTEGETIAAARDPHATAASRVRAIIDGLAAQSLRLDSANYSFQEDRPNRFDTSGTMSAKDKNKVVYIATTTLQMSTENLAKIADLATALANSDLRLENIHFTVKNPRLPLLEARKDAARDALDQAKAYAAALDIDLVEIRNITDGDATPPGQEEADLAMAPREAGKPPLSIIIPDTLTYTARVNIDWTIKSQAP